MKLNKKIKLPKIIGLRVTDEMYEFYRKSGYDVAEELRKFIQKLVDLEKTK